MQKITTDELEANASRYDERRLTAQPSAIGVSPVRRVALSDDGSLSGRGGRSAEQ
jgi:hypothetical protein